MCYRQPYTTSTSTPPLYTQAYTCDMAVVQTLLQQQQPHPQLQPHQQQAATTRGMPLTGFVMSRAPGSGGDGAVYLLPSTTTAATTATTAGGAIGVGGMSATMMPTPPLCLPPAALNNVAAELTAVRVMGMQSRQPMSVSDGNGSGGLSLSCTPARPAFVQPAPSTTTTTTAAAMSTGEYTAYSGRVTVGHPRVPPSLSLCATAPPPQPPAAAATATTTTGTGTIGVSARPTVSAVRLLAPTMCATTLGSCINNNNNNGCGTAGGSGQGLATHTPQPAPTTTASHFFAAHTMNSGDSGAVHAALLTPTPTTHHNGSVAAVAPYTSSTKLDDSPTSMCSTVLCTHPSTPFAPHMSVSGQSSGTGSTVAAASMTGRGGGGAATTMTTVSTPTAATNADPSATTATFAKSPFGASSITLYPVDPSMLLPFANGASFLAIPSSMANASFLTLTTANAAPAAPPSQTTTAATTTNTTTATAAAATAPTTSLAMPMTSNMTTTTAPVASSLPPHAASAPAAAMMPTTMVHVDTHSDAAGQMTLAALQRNLTTHYGTHAVYVSQPNTPAPATALLTTMSPSMYDAAAPTTRAHVTAMTPTMVPASALHFAPVFAKGQPQQQQPQQLRYAQLQPQTQQASQPAGQQLPLLGVRGFVAPPPVGYRHVPHTTLITSVPPLALPLVRPGRVPAMVLC